MARAIRKEQNDQMNMFGDLFRFTIFRTLSAESLTSVAEIMRKEDFSAGNELTFNSHEIVFVAEGEGTVVRDEQTISRVRAGQSFNLAAIFSADSSDGIHSLTFRPATRGRLYATDRLNFRYSVLSSPQLGAALLKEICEQLAAQTNELAELRFRDSNTERIVGRVEALTEALLGAGTRSKTGITQMKYKLNGNISKLIAGAKQSKIRQFYIDSDTADEDRIRIINESECYRTTRFTSVDGKRTEFERTISKQEMIGLEKLRLGAEIIKSRYDLDLSSFKDAGIKKLTIDVFEAPVKHKDLVLLEADLDEKGNGLIEVENLMKDIPFEDVSKNDDFSNQKLASI